MKPSRPFLTALGLLLAGAILLGAASALGHGAPWLGPPWWLALCALLSLAAVDALALHRRATPRLERELPSRLALDHWSQITLSFHPEACRARWLQVFDHVPSDMRCEGLPMRIPLRRGQISRYSYRLRPARRGLFHFSHCEVQLPSPLGLWLGKRLLPLAGETRVYPNFLQLYGAQLSGAEHWLNQIGVRQGRRRGLGLEFHQLREFRDGDTLRQVDWKASARKRTPIAREYQDEKDQQILFLLDCGRRMRAQDDALAHFDHALNACLLLSYVALRQGDAVGLATFAEDQPRYLAPAKGQQQLNVLLNGLYDLQTSLRPADFSAAAQGLLARRQKRALVILISNLRDEDDDQLRSAARHLSRHHQLLIASLREEVLDRLSLHPVRTYQEALGYCGTLDYLQARSQLHRSLEAQGLPLLDVRPQELGPQLVSRYLAMKKAGTI